MDIKTGDDIQIDVIGFQRIRQITLCSGRIVCQDDITVANGIFSGCFQTVTGKGIRIFGEFNSIGKVIDIEIPVIAIYVFAVEEHILCHKGAYTGKSGITRDRTGKPWYYRNSKR